MRPEDTIAIMYEEQTQKMIDEMYREDPELDEQPEPYFDEADLYEAQIALGV